MKIYNIILTAILTLTILTSCNSTKKTGEKPNVLVIVADDLGYSDLSFLPQASEDVQTPNIDRIAERGIYFSNAYSTAPICSPARVGLLTGRYQQRWGNYWYGEGGLPANEATLPQLLKKQGYYNVKIGKTHLNGGPVQHPLDHGFDEFLGFIDHTWDYLRLSQDDVDEYGTDNARRAHIGSLLDGREKRSYKNKFTTDIFTDKALDAIQNKEGKPLYIELEYNAVHHPTYVCHPGYLEKYGIEQFPFWDPKVESYQKWHRKWGHLGEVDPDGRKRYLLQLEVMDDGIGKILDALEKIGELDNTIVVFLSDNGGTINTYAQNYPLNGFKYMFGEGGIRIPLMISYPEKIKPGSISNAVVSGIDIMPTILEAVGAETPENLDGKSVFAAIEEGQKLHEELFWSNGRDSWVVRKGKWKLAHNIGWVHNTYELEGGVAKPVNEKYTYPDGILLFDLDKDIAETTNLAGQYPEIVDELEHAYQKWRNEMSEPRKGNGELKKIPNPGKFVGNSLIEMKATVSSDGAETNNYNSMVIDGYDKTFWKFPGGDNGRPLPHFVSIDLKRIVDFSSVRYIPAPDKVRGRVAAFNIYISEDGLYNENPVVSGVLPDSPTPMKINFGKQASGRYLKFEVIKVHDSSQEAAIAEIDIE